MELQELLRIGTVTARNAEIMCCKVTFSDRSEERRVGKEC